MNGQKNNILNLSIGRDFMTDIETFFITTLNIIFNIH